jgi:hypothetical protein
MKRRRLIWAAGLAALLLALPFLLWPGYAVDAVLQGQHFNRELPTSHWAKAVRLTVLLPFRPPLRLTSRVPRG